MLYISLAKAESSVRCSISDFKVYQESLVVPTSSKLHPVNLFKSLSTAVSCSDMTLARPISFPNPHPHH